MQVKELEEIYSIYGYKIFELDDGNKRLRLEVYPFGLAFSRIDNVEGRRKKQGVTTALYSRALGIMQEEAERLGHPIEYTFSTSDSRMLAWAQDPEKGQGIFQWDRVDTGSYLFKAKKLIRPSSEIEL